MAAWHKLSTASWRPRRGTPTSPWADRLGTSSAILLGDLALLLSDEMLHSARLEPWQLDSARPLLNTMRSEVVIGQHLDLTTTGQPTERLDTARSIIEFKTARYTIQRPLQIGAALGGAGGQMLDGLAFYARPVGEAFQLRNDLLGVFGDPGQTGKSDLEDLRDGKATVLMAHALRSAGGRPARSLQALIGNPRLDHEGAQIVRNLLHDTGAVSRVAEMIAERARHTSQVLDTLAVPHAVRKWLDLLTMTAATRNS